MSAAVYLDYAATTPVDPQVVARMLAYLGPDGVFANPASRTHAAGRTAAAAVDSARQQVAALVNADVREMVWTSGATEANNLALKGAAHGYRRRGRHLITCKTEHKAVLDPCRELAREGFEITYLDPDPGGTVSPERLAAALRDDTLLVSLMHVNNETGVIQDIAALGAQARECGALFHVDAAQSVGKVPIDLATLPVDLMSFSAHKLYGPKGIGALYVCRRPRVRLEALIHGGGQERGLRAGTLPTHQIVGMGEAFRLAAERFEADRAHREALGERLLAGLRALPAVHLNGDPERRVGHILNLSFGYVEAEALIMAMPELAVSSGSACTSVDQAPSHVLCALGLGADRLHGALRLSLGRFTTGEDIDRALTLIRGALRGLRELSPLWELAEQGQNPYELSWEDWVG